jgi:hypothetical protein
MEIKRCSCCQMVVAKHRAHADSRPLLLSETFYKRGRSLLRHLQLRDGNHSQVNNNRPPPESAFAKLPRELREIIWRYILEGPTNARPAHFHVYDRVSVTLTSSVRHRNFNHRFRFDSCTYASRKSAWANHQANSRHNIRQISLLLTCRTIYEEALCYLYENTKFQLVILPGLARPRHRLSNKHCIGKLQDCDAIFARMEHVHLTVQPGEQYVCCLRAKDCASD